MYVSNKCPCGAPIVQHATSCIRSCAASHVRLSIQIGANFDTTPSTTSRTTLCTTSGQLRHNFVCNIGTTYAQLRVPASRRQTIPRASCSRGIKHAALWRVAVLRCKWSNFMCINMSSQKTCKHAATLESTHATDHDLSMKHSPN